MVGTAGIAGALATMLCGDLGADVVRLEPLDGAPLMRRRRAAALPPWRLCRGPGSLCQALGITRAHDGADLTRGSLRILDAPAVAARAVVRTPRIGVAYAGRDAARRWRFAVRGVAAVSGRRTR